MAKKYSRITTVPFAGFYCSAHDDELDRAFEGLFQDTNGTPNDRLLELAFEHVKWQQAQEAYGMAYIENFATKFEIRLLPEKMISPREYNLTTDRLFAFIPLSEVLRLRREVCEATFVEVCIENFTSRSGFISSYSNDPQDWGPVSRWDHNQIGTLVDAWARQSNGGKALDQHDEADLMEDDRCNGEIDNWVYSAGDATFERLVKIADYLRNRQERKYRTLAPA